MADEKKKDDGEESGQNAPAPGKSGSNKMLFIAIGGVLLLAAIGVPVALLMHKQTPEQQTELAPSDSAQAKEVSLPIEGADDEDELQDGEEPLGAIYPLESFVVNLNKGGYIRVAMQLEFAGREIPKKFYGRLIPTRDALIALLTTKDADELQTAKGKENLKTEVKDLINEALHKQEVKNVYFTQFVVQ